MTNNSDFCCMNCRESFNKSFNITYATYWPDSCRGKTCPDCGKERKLGLTKHLLHGWGSSSGCLSCDQMKSDWINGVCDECFYDYHAQNGGCVCFSRDRAKNKDRFLCNMVYFCPLCEKTHSAELICEKCHWKQERKIKIEISSFKFYPLLIGALGTSFLLGSLFVWFLLKLRQELGQKKNMMK